MAATLGMRRRGRRVRGTPRQAENAAHGGGPNASRRGIRASDGTPRHDSVMPRGFAAPGPAERKASEAPRIWGVPRRSERANAAPAAARGERERAPPGGVAAGCPAGVTCRTWGEGTPGRRDTVRLRWGVTCVTGRVRKPREATGKLILARGGATRMQSPMY